MSEISDVQLRLTEAIDACNHLAKDHAAVIIAFDGLKREADKLRGAFEVMADSRGRWKQRAVDAGWTPYSAAVVLAQSVNEREPWYPSTADGEPTTFAEYHDDRTLDKVRDGLLRSLGLVVSSETVDGIINQMQNEGILFRQRTA